MKALPVESFHCNAMFEYVLSFVTVFIWLYASKVKALAVESIDFLLQCNVRVSDVLSFVTVFILFVAFEPV